MKYIEKKETIPIYKKNNIEYLIPLGDLDRLKELSLMENYICILGYISVGGVSLCYIKPCFGKFPIGLLDVRPLDNLEFIIRRQISRDIKDHLSSCKFKDVTLIDSDTIEKLLNLLFENIHENNSSRFEDVPDQGVSFIYIEDYGLKLTIYNNEFRYGLDIFDISALSSKLWLYIDDGDEKVYKFITIISALFGRQPIIDKLVEFRNLHRTGYVGSF